MNQNFSYYSYSPDINRQLYGQEVAPNYDISRINSENIVIMQGLNDWIADTVDVEILINQLKGEFSVNRRPSSDDLLFVLPDSGCPPTRGPVPPVGAWRLHICKSCRQIHKLPDSTDTEFIQIK